MPRPDALYYGDYLQLDRLLDCQHLESGGDGPPAHDEMLFVIVHQAYELWFKQILWELDAVIDLFDREAVREEDVGRAVSHLQRVVAIQRVLVQQIDVLETMTPLDFLDFRDALIPASGFQSAQFRLVENRLGMRPGDRLNFGGTPYTKRLDADDRARVEAEAARPSLFDLLDRWLGRTPFLRFGDFDFWHAYRAAVERMLEADRAAIADNPTLTEREKHAQLRGLDATREGFDALVDEETYARVVEEDGRRHLSHRALQAALLINLYRDKPILHLPFRLLSALVEIDEGFTIWRYRHAQMVERMIGRKIGTGGSSGHDYLRATADKHRVFHDLARLSTFYIPRSALPELPPEVARTMDFHYST